jgi:hypothetical protein
MQWQGAAGWPVSQPADVAGPQSPYWLLRAHRDSNTTRHRYSCSSRTRVSTTTNTRVSMIAQSSSATTPAQQPLQPWQQPVSQEQQQPPAAAAWPGPSWAVHCTGRTWCKLQHAGSYNGLRMAVHERVVGRAGSPFVVVQTVCAKDPWQLEIVSLLHNRCT